MSSFCRTSFLRAFLRHSKLGHGPQCINRETVPEVGDTEGLLTCKLVAIWSVEAFDGELGYDLGETSGTKGNEMIETGIRMC